MHNLRVIDLPEIRRVLVYREIIDRMRDALIAYSAGECDTPMPMHLAVEAEQAEVHIKSSYRRGGLYFVLKIASTFPRNAGRALSTGNGMMLLSSAETGEPLAFLSDGGHLTDVRTAAVAAMTARELRRSDRIIGVLGTGIQARLQARMHAEILKLDQIWIWGRTPERAEACRRDLAPLAEICIARSPAEVAERSRLIITSTPSCQPLLHEVAGGTHISAVGSDSPGKQELAPGILLNASLVLVDSWRQCEKLGELQHAPDQWDRSIEIGVFCKQGAAWDASGVTVADFTGLGVEDLYIAEYCYERITA
jgi:ornithine cyclodeaminase